MAALDDYAPLPLWLVICRVLELHPEGLSVQRTGYLVGDLTRGRHVRRASISDCLARMREDGMCSAELATTGRRTAHIHTLTDQGRELYAEARADLARILGLRANDGGDDGD